MYNKLKQASNQPVDQITGAAIPSRAVAVVEAFTQSPPFCRQALKATVVS